MLAVQADVTKVKEVEGAVTAAVAKFGKLGIVFANAGIPGATPIGNTSLGCFGEIVRTNLTAVFFTVQASATHLNPGASIILNGSVHAVFGVPGYSAYAATKAGVCAMTRNLASELVSRGIRVNQVTPGGTKTPIWSPQAPTAQAMSVLEQRLAGTTALGRMGEAEEIAKAALYLASDEVSYVTGTEIVVDGGATGASLGALIYRDSLAVAAKSI